MKRLMPGSLRAVAEWIADRHVEQSQLGIDGRRLPDAAAIALAADPGRAGDLPALILFVLRNRVEVPEDLAGLGIDGQHVAAGNVALASRAADVEHAVVHLRRGREPIPQADGGLHLRVSRLEHVEDHAGLAVVAEAWNRLPCLGVEREQERARRPCRPRRSRSRRRGCGRRSLPALPPPIRLVTSYVHRRCPSAALTAYTLPRESVTYITPSTMTGVVWLLTPSMTPCWKSHRGVSDFTFEVLIWSSVRESAAGQIQVVERPVDRRTWLSR